jgi:outer membrane protein assembly factor BamB
MKRFSGSLTAENLYPVGLALDDSGDLYATFHIRNAYPYQVGIAKIAPDGAIIWFKDDLSHHWPTMGEDGRVYSSAMREREDLEQYDNSVIKTGCDEVVYDEGVRVYDADGAVAREYWMSDVFSRSGYRGALYATRSSCDPFHVNSVDVATTEEAASQPWLSAGDILVSVREPGVIMLIDHETGLIKRYVQGRTAGQHAAHFLRDGRVVAFDNQGGDPALGGTRIVRIDLDTGDLETIFPRSADQPLTPFFAEERGSINVSADGRRMMVAAGLEGHVVELDVETGTPLWVMDQTLDISAYARMKHIKTSYDNARFIAYGAYYAGEPAFLADPPR